MTQEEKQLLLIDLCARLPYGIKFYVDNTIPPIPSEADYRDGRVYYTLTATGIDICEGCIFTEETGMDCVLFVNRHGKEIQVLKPYLRPMSSMTKKEEEEFNNLPIYHSECLKVDFYNSHHLDYRGLIPMGLAMEAPADMYHNTNLDVVDTVDDIMYDIDSDNVEVIYKSGKKTIHNIESLKLISSDERELGTEHDYLIEPNIHVVFYPEGHLSTFYFDE